jgi:hypothetical protein
LQVTKAKPNDVDAKMKYTECNKIVKQMAFERAIRVDDTKRSIADSINLENMGNCCEIYRCTLKTERERESARVHACVRVHY